MNCASGQSIHGKASGVAEEIENAATGSIALHKRTVFSLIKKKSCFLSFCPVHYKFVPIFKNYLLVVTESVFSIHISVDQIEPRLERRGARTLVVNRLQSVTINRLKRKTNLFSCSKHSNGMGLHHAYTIIVVNNKPGKAVSFPMNQTVTVCFAYNRCLRI